MPFRKKGRKNWQYDFRLRGRRFFGSCGTADFEEAKAVEAEARFKARDDSPRKGIFTMSQALGTYWQDVCAGQPSAAVSASQARMILTHFAASQPISTLTNGDLMQFVRKGRATLANATVNRRLELLARALNHMVKFYDAKVPALDFKAAKTREPKERIRFLSDEEESRLFSALRPDLHTMVRFALMTGARQHAIYGLRWRNVSAESITFRNKGGGTYQLPVSQAMKALLSALPRSLDIEHVHTWQDRNGNRRGFNSNNHWMFERAVMAAEIEDFRFHDLRHTFATRLLRQTQNLKLVSELLGHSDVATTARYAHVLGDDKRAALEAFSGAFPTEIPTDRGIVK
jgi:integrase